ncbi:MAG: aminotransferase class IV [Rhodothermia bacterium]|nr:aminotransferase class IV [Rhodothermia bacterium]
MTGEPDFGLIETMRCEGEIPLLYRHMARLAGSASHFGIPLDVRDVRQRILDACARQDSRSPSRVRLVVGLSGEASISVAPISPVEGRLNVAISATRLDPQNENLYHKTTRREVYDSEWRAAQKKGLFELIYLNSAEKVCEGSRTNIFVRSGGEWATPRSDAGLLPGVYRSLILETFPSAVQRDLHRSELTKADALFVCNAVVGLRRVQLIDSEREFNASI